MMNLPHQNCTSVDVCITTFRRTELLHGLIKSIEQQKFSRSIAIHLIVVDNDRNCSAKETIDSIASNVFVTVIYDVEPIQNIALARNRALSAVTSDYMVFVDDDEYVAEDWLENLIQTAELENADVVFGPVIAVYPSNTPKWIINGGFFDRPRYSTGTLLPIGASGNTLIKSSSLGLLNSFFDSSFGLTGGEDSEFFSRLYKQGARMVWCDKALAYEEVPYQRMQIDWLLGRHFRGGQSHWRIFASKQSVYQRIFWFLSRMVLFSGSLLLAPLLLVAGKSNSMKMLRRSANYAGQLSAVLGVYKKGY